jgi:hypothetical protein
MYALNPFSRRCKIGGWGFENVFLRDELDALAIVNAFQAIVLELSNLGYTCAHQEDGIEMSIDENQMQLLLQGVKNEDYD